jgi:hypothetical protein
MSSLISDVLESKIAPGTCNAAVNAGGKLLKVVEMQYRYGRTTGDGAYKELTLFEENKRLIPETNESTRENKKMSRIEMLEAEIKELRANLD